LIKFGRFDSNYDWFDLRITIGTIYELQLVRFTIYDWFDLRLVRFTNYDWFDLRLVRFTNYDWFDLRLVQAIHNRDYGLFKYKYMTENELKDRFKKWALEVLRFTVTLPETPEYRVIRNQLVRSSTSSASNYRASCRSKSTDDFIYKLKIVEEELDESMFWLEMIVGLDNKWRPNIVLLYKEADELLSIIVSSLKTTRSRKLIVNRINRKS
jgi:four helix bundle protein